MPTFYETLREITEDQREVGYNHPLINFLRTAIRWSIQPKFRQANVVITPLDVARLMVDFEADLARSREVVADIWQARPLWEKLVGTVAWILERQQ